MPVVKHVLIVITAALIAGASSASADVILTQNTGGKAVFISLGGESVTKIKGNRMRTDLKRGNDTLSTIFDLDAQTMTSLDHTKKEAQVWNLSALRESLSKVSDADIKAKLTPTAETKEIAGHACTVHDMSVTLPFAPMEGQNVMVVISGPSCLAKDAPGYAEYAHFYKTAAEKGFVFGDPRAIKAQPAQAKGMAALYKAMADAGMPLSSDIKIAFDGSGMFAAIMNRAGKSTITNVVTKLEQAPVGDDVFAVPDGYKVKEEK
jgi:hypothetical protein